MINKLSPRQCRAARDLLEIDQSTLAARAGVSIVTVTRFEKQGQGSDPTKAKLREALEQSGVTFLGEGETAANGVGEGVRLKATSGNR